jgi:outer membrane protein assembly factor BamB
MYRDSLRTLAAVVAGVAFSALGVTAAGAPAAAPQSRQVVTAPAGRAARAPAPGTQLWAERLSGSGGPETRPSSLAVSPDGRTVFITVPNPEASPGDDYVTAAYNAATGALLWTQRYNGPVNGSDTATAVAVSPTGAAVFVTGTSAGTEGTDYATVAYDAATGARLWVTRYHNPGSGADVADSVAVSPGGGTVFITGTSWGSTPTACVTAAYNATTGAPLWTQGYNTCLASSLAVSPTGDDVFVTGTATVAYDAATGARLWAKPYHSRYAASVAVSPDEGTVVVTGTRYLAGAQSDDITIAYRASGARLWTQRYGAPAHYNEAAAVAISPDGRTAFITGQSEDTRNHDSFDTIAYRTPTGAQLWAARYNKPEHQNLATALAVSPTSGTVYVTGDSEGPNQYDYATVAYDPATGARLWAAGYNGPANGNDLATAVAASPHGTKVFVTGSSPGSKGYGYLTIAYQG